MRKILTITVPLLLSLAGCATPGPTIMTNANPGTDFASLRTYNFMQPLSTDRAGGAQTPLSAMLISAMSREMANRGFQQSDTPDLLINFFVSTEERMQVRTTPTSTSFHGYRRGRYSAWPSYRTTVRHYTRGTLAIDIVDTANNFLAWEGVAQNRMGSDLNAVTQEQTDDVVGQIMAEFMPGASE